MESLPNELFTSILQYLPGRDRKNLRLTNRMLCERVPFQIERVFLSPSYKNITVFSAILADNYWRQQIREIVWDDAKFSVPPEYRPESDCDCEVEVSREDEEEAPDEVTQALLRSAFPTLLTCAQATPAVWSWMPQKATVVTSHMAYEGNTEFSHWFPVVNGDPLPEEKINRMNRVLANEQEDIITAGTDRELFRAGLLSFPALKRVTVTPTTHRMFPFLHEYDTPLLRSLPAGFRMRYAGDWDPLISFYNDADYDKYCSYEWRGFNIVVEELYKLRAFHNVSELLVNPGRKLVGVNRKLLDRPDNPPAMYSTLSKLFECVQLTRLEISFRVPMYPRDWGFLRNGLLKRALERLTHLQELSLHTTDALECDPGDHTEEDATSLFDYLPIHGWPRLQSLTLARLRVIEDDLSGFIRALPSHVEDFNLETLRIFKGDWRSLYRRVKNDVANGCYPGSPRFRFAAQLQDTSRYIRIDDELQEFLYGDGPNPFDGDLPPHYIQFGFGVVVDSYDKGYRERFVPPPWYRNVGPGRWVEGC